MRDETIENIGHKHTKSLGRDAIHVAVVQAECGDERLFPGELVRISTATGKATSNAGAPFIGVVDPFLRRSFYSPVHGQDVPVDHDDGVIRKGELFFIFLFPQTITGLRHEWTHPILDAPQKELSEAERWLRGFADRWSMNYDDLIDAATSREDGEWGQYITALGKDLHSYEELGSDGPLFWENLEKLTGQKFEDNHRKKFTWSCTC